MESAIISKVWNFANVLRDDGVGYGECLCSDSLIIVKTPTYAVKLANFVSDYFSERTKIKLK